jgi:hypothetical protein
MRLTKKLTQRQKKVAKILAIATTFTLPGIAAIAYTLIPTQHEPIAVDIARPKVPVIDQNWENNPHYCDEGGDIAPCHQQLMLRLWNKDPESGRPGLIQEMVAREAARIKSRAIAEQANSNNLNCYQQSLEICLNSIAENTLIEYQSAVSEVDKVTALFRYAAVNEARFGGVIPTTPSRFTPLATIENFESQLARHYGMSEAAARQQLSQGRTTYNELSD